MEHPDLQVHQHTSSADEETADLLKVYNADNLLFLCLLNSFRDKAFASVRLVAIAEWLQELFCFLSDAMSSELYILKALNIFISCFLICLLQTCNSQIAMNEFAS